MVVAVFAAVASSAAAVSLADEAVRLLPPGRYRVDVQVFDNVGNKTRLRSALSTLIRVKR
jgi:hypothetical protein